MDPQLEYSKDSRIPCQYGRKCYQKNPNHHKKYKHPPDPKRKNQYRLNNDNVKKLKLNDPDIKNVDLKPDDEEIKGENPIKNDTELSKTPEIVNNDEPDSDSEVQQSINNGSTRKTPVFNNDVSDSDSENAEDVHSEKASGRSPKRSKVFSNSVSDSDSEEPSRNFDTLTEENAVQHSSISSSQVETVTKSKVTVCNHKSGHNNEGSKKYIKSKFLVEMPDDFYKFFDLCESLNASNPSEALSSIGLKLVGPFDVLSGKFCGAEIKNEDYLVHWRYYRDPPNLQTVLKGDDKTGYHIGYFRDSPDDKPVFMVENCAMKDGILTPLGENIFGAVSSYIEDKKKTCDPFSKMKFDKIYNVIRKEAERLGYDISRKTKAMTKRNSKVLSRTFNKVGLVVPYERKTQLGYRKLAMSEKDLDALLTKIDRAKPEEKSKFLGELQSEILTWTDIASDECDFGTGIELGWDIICHGVDLNHTASRLLASNFRQLKWEAFAKIAEAHMANRRKGSSLSVI